MPIAPLIRKPRPRPDLPPRLAGKAAGWIAARALLSIAMMVPSAAPWPAGALAAAPTLCRADEMVVFSCPTGAHTASVCGSKNISKSSGYLQYRFGSKAKIELAYPDPAQPPAAVFSSGTMMFSGGGGAWLRLHNGPFSYTIFTAIGKWARSGGVADAAGVAVAKDGKEVANFPCRAEPQSEIGPDFFERAGINAVEPQEEFDIPEAFMAR